MRSTRSASVFCTVILILVTACGSPQDEPGPDEGYVQAVQDAEAVVGFPIYVPGYVPDTLPEVPVIDPFHDLAVLLFISSEDPSAGEEAWLNFLEIRQRPMYGTFCPPCPDDPPEVKHFETKWGETAERQYRTSGEITQEFHFPTGSVDVAVRMIWYFNEAAPPELPDEFHDESIRIIESLTTLEDG